MKHTPRQTMGATLFMMLSVTLYIGCQQTSAPKPPTAKTIAKPQPSQQRQTPQPKSQTQPTIKRPATPLFLLEDKLQNAWIKDNKGLFLILVHGKCPGSMGMEKALSLYQQEGSLPIPYKTVQLHQMEKLPIFATPWLLLVRDGQIVDGHLGGSAAQNKTFKEDNRIALNNLLIRQSVIERAEQTHLHSVAHILQNKMLSHRSLGGIDVSNRALIGYHMKGSVLSGSNFENTDLSQTNLSATVAVKASFLGANLKDTSLANTDWRQTTCPNGELSDDHGFSCACCRTP